MFHPIRGASHPSLRDDSRMDAAFSVASVRRAEEAAMVRLPADALMQRAAFGLATRCAELLVDLRGAVAGARVVVLTGSGNNGGDALWAASMLASRGVAVTAVLLSDRWHSAGAAALVRAGGRLEPVDLERHGVAIDRADLVLDGILGIGGSGALRSPASDVAVRAAASSAFVVAVDLPSGVDADTGAIADPVAVVIAQETVTFGCLKPGLLVSPGAQAVGRLTLVDIGLPLADAGEPIADRVDESDAAALLGEPGPTDDKYTRGVIGVVAGSLPYPGAGILCSGSARLGGAGMVRYAGSAPDFVIARWPEVVVASAGPAQAGRVEAWVLGPGAGTDDAARQRLVEVLDSNVVAVIDADGLTLIAEDQGLRAMVAARWAKGLVTVITPHAGEFARLGFELPADAVANRVAAVKAAAAALGAVVLLKGHETVVADPDGFAFVNTLSDSALATAGSGDVLAGLLGSLLAAEVARHSALDSATAAQVAACAALIHGLAGRRAAATGRPVTSEDVLSSLPEAIAGLRRLGDAVGRRGEDDRDA